jgi:hypothetical protein
MSRRAARMAASLWLTLASSAVAQWVNVPAKPDLDSATPRTPDGKPALSGAWEADQAGFSEDLGAYR